MQAEEAQLQYMHLYKKMDAVYYQMAIAQKLTPSEMDIYYTICVLGDGCLQRDVCNLALTSKQTINSALKKWRNRGFSGWKPAKVGRNTFTSLPPDNRNRMLVCSRSTSPNSRHFRK